MKALDKFGKLSTGSNGCSITLSALRKESVMNKHWNTKYVFSFDNKRMCSHEFKIGFQ